MFWARKTDAAASELPEFSGGGHQAALVVVRRKGVRRMTLRLDQRRNEVRLTLPPRGPLGPALDWVESKRSWVEAQLAARPAATGIVPGMVIPFAGEDFTLDWQEGWPRTPKIADGAIRIGGPMEGLDGRLNRWLKRQALDRLSAETAHYAAKAGVTVSKVGVGDPVSRWGSCASNGAIRYSWRLILAPEFVLRATVAHEVAHRVHMDHSARFHALVATLLETDPKPARQWLRQHGQSLHAFGRA